MVRRSNVETLDPPEGSPEWRALLDRTEHASNTAVIDPDDTDDTDENETSEDRVQQMLRTISGGSRSCVKLYRTIAGRKQWCKDYSPAEFEHSGMTQIREDWGAGEFEVVLYGERVLATGKTHYGVRGRVTIEIAAPVRVSNPIALPLPSAIPPEFVNILQSLAEGQRAIVQALSQRPEPVDPAAQMRQTFEMLKLAREASAPPAAAAPPSNTMAEMMAAFRLMKEMSAEINPPAEPQDPLMAALPMVSQLLARGNPPALPPEPFPQLALPASMNPATEPTIPQPDESQAVSIAILRAQVNMLVELAKKGDTTIQEGAKLVYEKAPDEIIELLDAPGWLDQLALFVPAVVEHRGWFERVGKRVGEMLDADEGDPNRPMNQG